MDLNANWMWGNFFYNVSYAVSEIDGIQMTSKNSYITVFGQANSKPICMTLSKTDGSIITFFTVDVIATSTTTPTYLTPGAFYYEEDEALDGQSYVYMSFVM
jgi:hypothetical protein